MLHVVWEDDEDLIDRLYLWSITRACSGKLLPALWTVDEQGVFIPVKTLSGILETLSGEVEGQVAGRTPAAEDHMIEIFSTKIISIGKRLVGGCSREISE